MTLNDPQYTLSIDPASRQAGVSVWYGPVFLGAVTLVSVCNSWSARVAEMRVQLREFVKALIPPEAVVTRTVIELVPKIVEPSIQMVAGALLADPYYQVSPTRKFFVSPSTWKAFCRRKGCPDKDPKGMKALQSIGWTKNTFSDDVADSILIYMTWLERYELTESGNGKRPHRKTTKTSTKRSA